MSEEICDKCKTRKRYSSFDRKWLCPYCDVMPKGTIKTISKSWGGK